MRRERMKFVHHHGDETLVVAILCTRLSVHAQLAMRLVVEQHDVAQSLSPVNRIGQWLTRQLSHAGCVRRDSPKKGPPVQAALLSPNVTYSLARTPKVNVRPVSTTSRICSLKRPCVA